MKTQTLADAALYSSGWGLLCECRFPFWELSVFSFSYNVFAKKINPLLSLVVLSLVSHPSILIRLVRGRGGSDPDFPLTRNIFQPILGDPEAIPGQFRDIIPPACPWPSQDCVWIRCPNHLSWLLSTRRSSGSTPSSLLMSELRTLSPRLSPATLQRKLIDSHPSHITPGCKTPQWMPEVTVWGCQQDHIVCKQQRGDPETPRPDLLHPQAVPGYPVHENHKQDRW